jgi:hypothetical protein
MMNIYFTNEGPERGRFLYGDAQGSTIGVMKWPDATRPVGRAFPTSWADDDAALWKLIIGDHVLPGRFVIRDRRFSRAH